MTPPTTMAGVLATLDHASRRPDQDDNGDHVYPNFAEAAQYAPGDGDPDGILKAGEPFPAMIAATLRQIVADKVLLQGTGAAAFHVVDVFYVTAADTCRVAPHVPTSLGYGNGAR